MGVGLWCLTPIGVILGGIAIKRSVTTYVQWAVLAIAAVLLILTMTDKGRRSNFLSGPGLASGALIAAIALGVVLTYRGSGVVNFANGAVGMYVAYVYALLRRDGDLFLPPLPNPLAPIEGIVNKFRDKPTNFLPDWPTRISFGGPMKFLPAFIISLVFCVLLGFIFHALIFRPLRNAPPLAKVVASVGLFLLLQAIAVRRFSTTPLTVAKLFKPSKSGKVKIYDFAGVRITKDQLLVVVLVVICTAALWALFRLTRFGLATRAASENEKGSILLGFSPEFYSGANWILSTVITGLLGILVAGVNGTVDPATTTLLIIPALSAALVGNLTSFGWTTLAAFLLGMTSPLIKFLSTKQWFPKSGNSPMPGVANLVPFLVIVLVLFLRGKSLPTRGAISAGRLPFAPRPSSFSMKYLGPIGFVGCTIITFFFATSNGRFAITNTLVGIVISLSFVVITGFVGQISLAQMVLAGVSGFFLSKLTTEQGVPFPISPLIGAVGAMLVGLIVAIPALRVRGVNLAIITFAFAIATEEFLFKNPTLNGGLKGAPVKVPSFIDPNKEISIVNNQLPNPWFTFFCLVVATLLCYAISNLRRSGTGRRMLALRSNERAAAAAGVNIPGTKLMAFALAAFIAGLGGALSGYRFGSVTQQYFGGVQSLVFLAFAYLGGIACVSGAVSAGFLVANGVVFTILAEVFGVPPEFTLILGGLGLITTAIANPEGVAGGIRQFAELFRMKRRAKTAGVATLEVAT
jgi:branched-chain amino acid transport system permease protein